MNVGICIRHEQDGLEEKLMKAELYGFRHIQLISWDSTLWNQKEADRVCVLLQETGITITAFWCGWEGPKVWDFLQGPETLGLVPPSYRYVRMKNLLSGAAFAKMLGVRNVVSHMGFIPEVPSDPNYPGFIGALRYVAQQLKGQGQNLLFETGQETPVAMLRCFEDIALDNLYVNLDPANLILYGKANPVDSLDIFGHLVRGVHAKDGLYPKDGKHLGTEVKVGLGKVNFPVLLKKLKALGYDGSLTIEREISGEQQIKDILEAQSYLNALIKEA